MTSRPGTKGVDPKPTKMLTTINYSAPAGVTSRRPESAASFPLCGYLNHLAMHIEVTVLAYRTHLRDGKLGLEVVRDLASLFLSRSHKLCVRHGDNFPHLFMAETVRDP